MYGISSLCSKQSRSDLKDVPRASLLSTTGEIILPNSNERKTQDSTTLYGTLLMTLEIFSSTLHLSQTNRNKFHDPREGLLNNVNVGRKLLVAPTSSLPRQMPAINRYQSWRGLYKTYPYKDNSHFPGSAIAAVALLAILIGWFLFLYFYS